MYHKKKLGEIQCTSDFPAKCVEVPPQSEGYVCPMVVGMDTWNPVTGKCGPGPSVGGDAVIGSGQAEWNPQEPIQSFGYGGASDQSLPMEQVSISYDTEQPTKKSSSLITLGVVAVIGLAMLTKKKKRA